MAKKKGSVATTLGGVIVGLDYQIFRTGKPPSELVESAKPVAPVPAEGGGTLSIELPDVAAERRSDVAGDEPGEADRG